MVRSSVPPIPAAPRLGWYADHRKLVLPVHRNRVHVVPERGLKHRPFRPPLRGDPGVVPRKSGTAKVIGLEHNRFFWLGAVCGDGCVKMQRQDGKLYPFIAFCGSRPMVGQFAVYAAPFVGRVMEPWKSKHAECWSVQTSGRPAVRLIGHLFHGTDFALPRKLADARQALKWSPVRPYYGRSITGPLPTAR